MNVPPSSPALSPSQLATLRAHGEERTAAVGEVLFRVGDARYPFIAIIEGEAAILDAGRARDRPPRRLGLSRRDEPPLGPDRVPDRGGHAADALHRGRPRRAAAAAVRGRRRSSDLLLSAFMARREALQRSRAWASRSSARAPRSRRGGWSSSPAATACPTPGATPSTTRRARDAPRSIDRLEPGELPLVRLPGGPELRNPTSGEVSRALGIGLELAPARGGRPASSSAAARPVSGAAVYGASEGLDTLVVEGTALGGQAGTSRRIENYLGFPAGISGSELTSRAVTQARKFNARTATPYRAARARARSATATSCASRTTTRSPPAPSCSPPAPNIGGCPSLDLERLRGHQRLLRGRAARGAALRRRRASA